MNNRGQHALGILYKNIITSLGILNKLLIRARKMSRDY